MSIHLGKRCFGAWSPISYCCWKFFPYKILTGRILEKEYPSPRNNNNIRSWWKNKNPVNLTSWGKGSFSQYENRVSYMLGGFLTRFRNHQQYETPGEVGVLSSTSKGAFANVGGYVVIVPWRVSIQKKIPKDILPWTHPKIQSHPLQLGVSTNRGTPKWMVYNGKPY